MEIQHNYGEVIVMLEGVLLNIFRGLEGKSGDLGGVWH